MAIHGWLHTTINIVNVRTHTFKDMDNVTKQMV